MNRTMTGGINTNDWIASMQGILIYPAWDWSTGGSHVHTVQQQAEDAADVEIARARLAEIKESPERLLIGEPLRERLSRI